MEETVKKMQNIRNIAIIAHVDHGKTTLVDKMLWQAKLFRENQDVPDLILDSNDLERERGITILSKNVSIRYQGVKINIIDTPGHSDFGAEVERVLNMADGVLLLVDAFEGPMPQTRFVLQKAIEMHLKPVVVVNKVDKPNCDPEQTLEDIFELMFALGADEEQLNFATVFGSSKEGWMGPDWRNPTSGIGYLLDVIVKHIPPPVCAEGTTQMMISSLDYSSYVGRIAIGKLARGTLTEGANVSLVRRDGSVIKSKIKELFVFEGLSREKTDHVEAGDICAVLGMDGFEIGDTIADFDNPEALSPIRIDEPTMSMLLTINNSPFFGQEGKYVNSRQLRDRLYRELEKNLALRVEETGMPDTHIVYGRGILHLSILIETMRREGYEMQVGQPKVIIKEIDRQKCEPVEELTVDVAEQFSGRVIDLVTRRKGEILSIEPKTDRIRQIFKIPSRGIIGLRSQMLTATEGEAVMSHRLLGFEPYRGDIFLRRSGSLIAMETGTAYAYALDKLQDKGSFFIEPFDKVYEGQVVGQHIRQDDLIVKVTRTRKLTNMRAAGSEDKIMLTPALKLSLEEYMEYIAEDEYLEITPQSLRLRKIILSNILRKRTLQHAEREQQKEA